MLFVLAIGCTNDLVGADGTGDTSSGSTGLVTTVTITSTSASSVTTVSATATTDDTATTADTSATTADTSATTADTSATTEDETGDCPVGAAGCPCTGGGSCDGDLVCIDETCGNPECPIGSAGCPCTGGGACDPGLECVGGDCVDPGGTEGCPVGSAGCPCTGGGACDRGLVCEMDSCVDAPASTSDASTSSPVTVTESSSDGGIPPDCGDGNIDPGESCDDGDQVQGNGCNNNCVDSGTELWTIGYAGPDLGNDQARDVAVDANDDIVVTGVRTTAGAGHDIITRKYDSDGGLIWERTYATPGDTHDEAFGVAIDDVGSIVISGYVFTDGNPTAWVRKYNSDGQVQWTDVYVGEGSTTSFGVAIDQAGDVVVVGYASVPGEGENTWVRKYSSDGGELWEILEDQGLGINDVAYGVHTDEADNIIISGAISSTAFARGYDPDGGMLWSQEPLNTTGLWGVASYSTELIYVAGGSSLAQARLQRLDEDGQLLWTQNYTPNGGTAGLLDVTVDSTGAVIVCGAEQGNADIRLLTRKYSGNGSAYWTRTYAGVANQFTAEEAWGVAVDSADNVIVVGYESVGGQEDWWIRKYTP